MSTLTERAEETRALIDKQLEKTPGFIRPQIEPVLMELMELIADMAEAVDILGGDYE